MSWLRRRNNAARTELEEVKRLLRGLRDSGARKRAAVGTGVGVANSDFLIRFGTIDSFRGSAATQRERFYERLADLELGLRNEAPDMALGIGLYRIWLDETLAGRREAAELLGEELTELSRGASGAVVPAGK